LLLVGSAAASSGSSVATYGPTRDWGGTQIRSLDPVPSLPASSGPGASAETASVSADQTLSNEFTFTQWAYVARVARIYATPSLWSRGISRLHWYTEDGFPEIYPLLRAHWDSRGREWVQLRIPGRPNGRTGWVLRSTLGRFHMTHQLLVVNRRTMHMYFYDNGARIWSAPVGIGKPSTPTPRGHFWIRERFAIASPASGYYPYAFGTADYSTLTDWPGGGVVGIHGPFGASWRQIPGRISHGCIRLHVPDDFWLGRHLHVGTPLWVK
jgi:hypothetical protein